MASAQPVPVVVQDGPPMEEVKNIFFKAHSTINYFADEVEADNIENETAFQYFNKSLECSSKYGCLLMSFEKSFYVIRAKDALAIDGTRTFNDLEKLEVRNEHLPATPNIIALSHGEEYLAVDTIRGDSGWLVIYKLADFLNQAGASRPFCEVRCTSSANIRISSVSWNPGENMNNIVAISTDDGSLFLAKINGSNNMELNRLPTNDITCLCWSPKGKQLVVGRVNGSLSQLKLDLSVAKQIPAPEPGTVPISILWTQTTQFLIVFKKDDGIDFMQLDLVKGGAVTYKNSGDIFISEVLPEKCGCFFVPFVQWNVVLAMTNSASDIVVLIKQSQNPQSENWVLGDVADNRRAAFLLDNYARGVTVFYGSENGISFSETEVYSPMPVVFLLSQRGSLSSYSIINSGTDAQSLNSKVTSPLPDSLFLASQTSTLPQAISQAPVTSTFPQEVKPPLATLSFGKPGQMLFQPPSASVPVVPNIPTPPTASTLLFKTNQPTSALSSAQQQQPVQLPPFSLLPQPQSQSPSSKLLATQSQPGLAKPMGLGGDASQQQQLTDVRQLGTSTLPTSLDMAGLQKAVEEKRREMTTQLQKGSRVASKSSDDEDQSALMANEIKKFEQRLSDFRNKVDAGRRSLNEMLNISGVSLEKSVLTTLNSVEDFSSDMVSTTNAQKEEVDVLKERILNHFSQLEYAKSLVERSRDPRYLEHLRSRPLDPASQQKFDEICRLHNYIKNQVSECRRYFYEQNRKRDKPLDRAPNTQLIYMTLSNHSKIIRRLKLELDGIKERLGLGKNSNAFDEAEFLAVCDASYTAKKISSKKNDDQDEITLNDLTAGISKVKLNRDSSRPDKKPIIFNSRKLLILSKSMPEVSVVKVKADETAWTRTTEKSVKPQNPTHATVPVEKSTLSKLTESSIKPEVPPFSLGSTFTIGPTSSTPFSHGAGGTSSQSILKSSITTATPNVVSLFGNQEKAVSPIPPVTNIGIQGKINENLTGASPSRPTSTASPQLAQKPSLPAFSSGLSASMSSPTLAGLLATPVSVSVSPRIGMSVPTTGSTTGSSSVMPNTGFPGLNVSFGSPGLAVAPNKDLFGTVAAPTMTVKQDTTVVSQLVRPQEVISNPSVPSLRGTVPVTAESPNLKPAVIGGEDNGKSVSFMPNMAVSKPNPGLNTDKDSSDSKAGNQSNFINSPTIVPTTGLETSVAPATITGFFVAPNNSTGGSSPAASTQAAALNLSSDTFAKSLLTSVSGATAPSSGLFAPSGLSFSSPTNSGGASGIFGQLASTKNSSVSSSPVPIATTTPSATPPSVVAAVSPKVAEPPVVSTAVSPPIAPVATAIVSPTSTIPAAGAAFSALPTVPTTSSSVLSGGLFASPQTASTTTSSIFGGGTPSFTTPTSNTSSIGIFGAPANTTATAVPSSTSLFGAIPTTGASSQFSLTPQAPAGSGIFSAPSSAVTITTTANITPTTSTGLFNSPPSGFFSQTSGTTAATTAANAGFLSSLSISDTASKPVAPANAAAGSLFSSPAFGAASSTGPGNIFGGGSTAAFTSQTQTTTSGLTFATTAGIFGGSAAAPPTSVFGGSPAFGGATSPFGSSFGGSNTPAFGGTGGSVFGNTTTSQAGGFGAATQQSNTPSAFGSPFGGSTQQQQTSIFGSPATQTKSTTSGGLFSSSFGSPAATTTGGIFGGGGSAFGGTAVGGGAFSSGASSGGVAQQGFGFAQPKPTGGASVFGSPPAAAAASPVFGGGATFGSTSPFGSSFSSQAAPAFGSGGNVFGGNAAAQPNTGFGTLAQQSSTTPGFGSPQGGGGFGAGPQSGSVFGSPAQQQQQQQQPKPTFGGQAFSSWR